VARMEFSVSTSGARTGKRPGEVAAVSGKRDGQTLHPYPERHKGVCPTHVPAVPPDRIARHDRPIRPLVRHARTTSSPLTTTGAGRASPAAGISETTPPSRAFAEQIARAGMIALRVGKHGRAMYRFHIEIPDDGWERFKTREIQTAAALDRLPVLFRDFINRPDSPKPGAPDASDDDRQPPK
jgi:hypothetical protein